MSKNKSAYLIEVTTSRGEIFRRRIATDYCPGINWVETLANNLGGTLCDDADYSGRIVIPNGEVYTYAFTNIAMV